MSEDEAYVLIVETGESGNAAELIVEDLLTSGADPAEILVVWMISHLRAPRLPSGVGLARAPEALSAEAAPLREIASRFAAARWWAGVERTHAKLFAARVHWFITTPISLPGNRGFFWREKASLSMLPDGMLNYAPSELMRGGMRARARYLARIAVEIAAAARRGLPYRPVLSGSPTQHENGAYDLTYTFEPSGLVTRSGEVVVLKRRAPGTRRRPDPAVAIIADQELRKVADGPTEARLRAALLDLLNGLTLEKIYYKQHPRGQDRYEFYGRGLTAPLIRAETGAPVEEMVVRDGIGTLASFCSTCLMTLGPESGVRRYAVMPVEGDPMVLDPLRARFRDAGVEIREIGSD